MKSVMCGSLRQESVGQRVTLAGWVNRRRDHGGIVFIDLRDRAGIVQVVFNQQENPVVFEMASRCRSEFVLQVEGVVRARPAELVNPNLPTGAIEVVAD
ncbi:MAG: aspartate--tRNA ligase, partial [Chloroflexi bacterium]|nr:aspartate--tRNA ligase [Chloroflexota bacterium]